MLLLLTGFGSFADVAVNPSQSAVEELGRRFADDARLSTLVLPVLWDETWSAYRAASTGRHDAVLHVGVGRTRSGVEYERFALNWRQGEDTSGRVLAGEPVVPGGPTALTSDLDASPILAALEACDVPHGTSNHAGTYLCNALLYRSLLRRTVDPQAPRAAFVHVPPLPDPSRPDAPSLSQADTTRALEAVVRALLEQ